MPSPLPFDAVFNCGPAGHFLLSPDADAIILAVNDTSLKATARRREDLVGISLFKAFPGNPNDPDDTGEAALRAALRLVRETGTSQVMPAQRYPIRIELPNGDVGYEERYWSAVNTPVFNDQGELVCISHTTSDVSDRVRADAALRDSEGRLRAYILATSDVVYRMNPDWTYLHQLDGRGFLKTTSELAEYHIEDYVHPDDLDRARQAIAEAIAQKAVFELEHRVLRSDGSFGWTYSRAVPRLDANGDIFEWIGAASDITERKLVEERLKDTDRRKDEFLAMLAHELRNPLAPIGSAAELLQRGVVNEDMVRKTSEIIHRQVRHMTGLVDDLLDVSRVTRGQVTLDAERLEVRQLVADAIEQVAPLIQSRRHRLTVQLTPHATLVRGDRKRLIQVIANLLNNAAKYTPKGGEILLRTDVVASEVVIEVCDNGVGIAPALTTRVFDLFTQAERTSDRAAGGLGLGLALVKSLVELHAGSVKCDSPGLNRGSRFTVHLPRLVAGMAGAAAPVGADTAQGAAPLRILLVDDNVDAASMLGMLLEASGHEVQIEHGARRALEVARMQSPQVCLLDIGLPERGRIAGPAPRGRLPVAGRTRRRGAGRRPAGRQPGPRQAGRSPCTRQRASQPRRHRPRGRARDFCFLWQ